jgi:hypothetical protein
MRSTRLRQTQAEAKGTASSSTDRTVTGVFRLQLGRADHKLVVRAMYSW